MHHIITFKTAKFDISKERENPINPIYGHSLLDWLKDITKEKVEISEPDAEDWGWYSYLKWEGRDYLIGASVHYEKYQLYKSELEWVFQVDKQRSFIEVMFGKEKMRKDDPCLLFFKSIFDSDSEFKEIEIE